MKERINERNENGREERRKKGVMEEKEKITNEEKIKTNWKRLEITNE